MGRTRAYDREDVLTKAMQVFWRQGFADTSLQDLEKATGLNKSSLYSEFVDKDDLFLSSLRHYVEKSGVDERLSREPLGLANIAGLFQGVCAVNKGCFMVNSVREVSILPTKARAMMNGHFARIKELLARNILAENPDADAETLSELIFTFNAGLCLEQNLGERSSSTKIEALLETIRKALRR